MTRGEIEALVVKERPGWRVVDFIEINGVGFRYELSGQGDRTIVLVHEMGGSLDSWDEVAPILAKNRRVLRYDTRGAGLSSKLRVPPTIDMMADDIAALLDAVGIRGKVALADVKTGSYVDHHVKPSTKYQYALVGLNRKLAALLRLPPRPQIGEDR